MPARPLHLAWSHTAGPPLELFVGRVDVVHGTNYVVPPTRRAARVVTVHDLTSLRYPEMCDAASLGFPRMVRRAVAAGAWVHTPSRFVADEVVAELGVDPSRVRAVHHGIPGHRPVSPGDAELAMPSRTTRYVLAIGTVEPRKDYPALVRSFDAVAEKIDDVALVIAGSDGWGAHALDRALLSTRSPERIVRLGYVEASRLDRLLAGASAVAYPSVYEGFGFVPLEAMAAGIPVVATAVGAIPEIAGDGALLVPPGDDAALSEALCALLIDETARATLIERGRNRASSFTWERCARGLSELYSSADAAR